MRIGKPDANKIIVSIKIASRGKDGRMGYETTETIEVHDATDKEVYDAVMFGLAAAEKKK